MGKDGNSDRYMDCQRASFRKEYIDTLRRKAGGFVGVLVLIVDRDRDN